mgnify:CR=1 FL=1
MKIEGVYTALITPFKKDGSGVDSKTLSQLIERQIEAGISGIIFGGSTGEGQTMELSELTETFETALPYKSKIQIIAACGFSSTSATAQRYEWLAKQGVDAVLVSTPPYNKPPQRGLVRHFQEIAQRATTPIIVYNIPGRTAVNLLPSSLNELWKIPHILAVKESSGSLEQMQLVMRDLPAGKVLLSGDDPLNLPVWSIGGRGTVSVLSNVAPKGLVKLWKLWSANQPVEAAKLQSELLPLTNLLFSESNPIPTKFCLSRILKKDLNPRLPLVPLDEVHHAKLLEELRRIGSLGYCEAV